MHACLLSSAGATGGVGKRVVQRLLEQGQVVRALVRDVDKAKSLLVRLGVSAASVCAPQLPAAAHTLGRDPCPVSTCRCCADTRMLSATCARSRRNRCMQASLPVGPSGALQLVAADISQRRTLTPDMFTGVGSVISCTAVKVQPKEGDTPDREKYYQVGRSSSSNWHVADGPQLVPKH